MAQLAYEADTVRIRLGPWERVGALRGDLVLPRTCLVRTRTSDDIVHEIRGVRAPGYGWPGHAAIGTWRGRGYKDLVVVYWAQRQGIVLDLQDAPFDRVVLSTGVTVAQAQRIAPAV